VRKWSLQRWFFSLSILPCLAVMLLLGGYVTYKEFGALDENTENVGHEITQQLANPTIFTSLVRDQSALQEFIHGLFEHEHVRSITLLDANHNLLAYAGPHFSTAPHPVLSLKDRNGKTSVQIEEKNNVLIFTAPIINHLNSIPATTIMLTGNGQETTRVVTSPLMGWVVVEVLKGPTTVKKYEVFFVNFAVILLGTLMLVLLHRRLIKRFTEPLIALKEKMERLRKGDFNWQTNTQMKSPIQIIPGINFLNSSVEFSALETSILGIERLLKNNNEHYFHQYEQQTIELQENLAQLEVRNVEIDLDRKNAVKESRIKSELVAGMHHEIRAPLHSLISFVELFAETKLSPFQHEYLNHARIALRQLSSSVDELVEAMLFDSNRFILAKCPIDLRECVDDALSLLTPQAYQKEIELISFIYPDVPLRLLGDSDRIKQLLLHFTGTIMFMGQKGDLMVRVRNTTEEKQAIYLCFEIVGKRLQIGMDDYNHLHALYGPSSADATNPTTNYQSQSIAKKLIAAMGGDISLNYDPEDDQVTVTFTCKLSRLAYSDEAMLPKEVYSECRVVVFDENPLTRAAIAQQCRLLDMRITETSQAPVLERVMEQVKNDDDHSIDVVIIGFNQFKYHEQDFRFFLEKIRRYYQGPIIAAVNTSDARLLEDIEFCGADISLIKPIAFRKLQSVFYELLRSQNSSTRMLPQSVFSSAQTEKTKILVIEDNPSSLKRLVDIFSQEGFQVVSANNGEQAVTLAEQILFNLIYLDIKLPDIDGFEVTRRIRALHKDYEYTPIIAVSAYISEQEEEILKATGINDFLIKPVKRSDIHRSLLKWIQPQERERYAVSEPQSVEGRVQSRGSSSQAQIMSRNAINTRSHQVDKFFEQQFVDLKVIDWNAAVEAANKNAIIAKEILGMLIESLPEFIDLIRTHYQANDYKKLVDQVHKLHGSASYCGVPRLKQAAYQCEKMLKSNDYEHLADAVEMLYITINEVMQAAPDYV
jgi:two-component system sensor histidine kinase BarA